jgi:bifunctional ADP-heptose synthase (sugar kinase/adenylyltransferase)
MGIMKRLPIDDLDLLVAFDKQTPNRLGMTILDWHILYAYHDYDNKRVAQDRWAHKRDRQVVQIMHNNSCHPPARRIYLLEDVEGVW